ncbi:GAF domain-containing sensor histidine kinase [Legionella saoudiensis]|uniref:GAF domain-containing sensor histidine kinase n=1 Tax=Legionella saoudiensis TaxID=1750561 RepID=UPI0007314E7F|nr:GAF domain-containing sensor histidine kinase [Legionella saoudiensis]
MPETAQSHEPISLSEGAGAKPSSNESWETVLKELNQLRQEKIYYQNQLAIYEKLHDKDRKDLKNALLERMRVQTVLRENKSWLNGQKEAFQAAMSGLPLTVSLKALVDTIVVQTNGAARAAFYRMSAAGTGLYHIVGMSEEYANDVNGFKVGPDSLACGLAMYKGEPVITPDIEEDPAWGTLKYLARKHNCRACWSFPIRTKDGPIVGTLGIYFNEPRKPTTQELELAGVLTHAAAIIISREQELVERTQVEEALRESEKKLKMSLRLRDEFIGNASHELNTPLTSMMIYAQILEQQFEGAANPRHTEMVIKLREQVDRLHVLIRDMLDTTRLAEGKLQLKISCFDLNNLIQEKAENTQLNTKKHQLELQLKPMEPIVADEERIGQVLINLISNAIKYSPLGGKIIISSEIIDKQVKVSVTDSGIGIPKEDFEKIFERFYRVISNEAKTFPGMGIGLSICKDIIEMHRGRFAVESQERIGSTLSFIIPIKFIEEGE